MSVFLSKNEFVHFIKVDGGTDKLDNATVGKSEEEARKVLGDKYSRTQNRIAVTSMSGAAVTKLLKKETHAMYAWHLAQGSPIIEGMDCVQVACLPYDSGNGKIANKATVVVNTALGETLEEALALEGRKPLPKAAAQPAAVGQGQPVGPGTI